MAVRTCAHAQGHGHTAQCREVKNVKRRMAMLTLATSLRVANVMALTWEQSDLAGLLHALRPEVLRPRDRTGRMRR